MSWIKFAALTMVGLALLGHGPASAQDSLESLFTPSRPASMSPADLPDDYKAYEIRLVGASNGMDMSFMWMGMAMGGGSNRDEADRVTFGLLQLGDIYWTKGESVGDGTDKLLVTYKLDLSVLDLVATNGKPPMNLQLRQVLIRSSAIGSFGPFPRATKESMLKLINAAQALNLTPTATDSPAATASHSSEPTSPEPPEFEARDASIAANTLNNIKQAALATHMYASDYDDDIPYVQSTRSAVSVLFPYSKARAIFASGHNPPRPFRLNMALAGVHISRIALPAEVVMWYEPQSDTDGRRAVAFADGHAMRLTEAEWRKASGTLSLKIPRRTRPLPADWDPANLFNK